MLPSAAGGAADAGDELWPGALASSEATRVEPPPAGACAAGDAFGSFGARLNERFRRMETSAFGAGAGVSLWAAASGAGAASFDARFVLLLKDKALRIIVFARH